MSYSNLVTPGRTQHLPLQDPIKSQYMDLAFYTERSTTDEVTRGAESDVLTIAVSYLVMFVYVSVALGKFTKLSRVLVSKGGCGLRQVSR